LDDKYVLEKQYFLFAKANVLLADGGNTEDVLKNAKCVEDNRVSVPKVVGEENE